RRGGRVMAGAGLLCRAVGALLRAGGPARAQADVGERVYQQALRSTVWIVVPLGGNRITVGSGSVIDAKQRLVLTNYHVVRGKSDVIVMFPTFVNGPDNKPELVVHPHRYIAASRTSGIHGKVLHTESHSDLALIQLERLPPGTPALRPAAASAAPGQRIHSIGNPAISDALWVYTPGSVRAVYRKQMRASDQ